jgi:ATP-dependent DNA helicase PIF1
MYQTDSETIDTNNNVNINVVNNKNKINFSPEQKLAYKKYLDGENIFITGPGGTGKSELIKSIYKHASSIGKNIKVTALTGCAAILLNCNASTLHSWAGIGLADKPVENIIKRICLNRKKKANWMQTEILIIDEVSMMSKKLFDILCNIASVVCNDRQMFGGIQLICSGDFYQLPPVGNKEDEDTYKFCFESENWNKIFKLENHIQLKNIFRQSDTTYSNILNQIREGRIKKSSNELLLSLVGKEIPENFIIKPTKIFPLRASVENINNYEMEKIRSKGIEYKTCRLYDLPILTKKEKQLRQTFSPENIEQELNYLISNSNMEQFLTLKKGSQVMCVINILDDKDNIIICNGSQGIVHDFDENFNLPIVLFNNGNKMRIPWHTQQSDKIPGIGIKQIPLVLAWAITIHKSQGSTLDAAEIDVGCGIFECGQTYVALSRVKTIEGLFLKSFEATKIKINKKVKDFYASLPVIKIDNDIDIDNKVENVVSEELQEETPIEEGQVKECVVCMQAQRNILFLPCKHLCVCNICDKMCDNCPICRVKIDEKMKIINC